MLLTMAEEQDKHAFMPVKNAQGMRFSSGQRRMAFNIYNKHLATKGKSKSQAVALTARDSDISKSTLWQIVKEVENEETISSPSKKRSHATLFTNLDEDKKKSICCTVHNFFQRNEIPMLDKILQQ